MKGTIKIPDVSIFLAVASTTLYLVFRNLPLNLGSFAVVWAPLSFFAILLTYPRTFIKGPMKMLVLYGITVIGILQYTLWKHMSDWNLNHILLEYFNLTIICSIFFFYWNRRDIRFLSRIGYWAFIFVIISLIMTNIALYMDPSLVRDSANSADFTPLQAKIYQITGAMGYSYIQAVICLIPILIYHIKLKRNMVFSPTVLIGIFALIIITVIQSQVFANILVMVVITLLSLIGAKKRRIWVIVVSIIGAFIISTPNSFFVEKIYLMSTFLDSDSVLKEKLSDFAVFIEDPEIDASTGVGSRASRYPMLSEALMKNPLFGDASYESSINISGGSHLYWMNRLALWGIPGFIFFLFVLFSVFKTISSIFEQEFRFYYYISLSVLLFLGLTKAIGGRELWLLLIVVIPGLYFLPHSKKGEPLGMKVRPTPDKP
jgi:hypothetical protein